MSAIVKVGTECNGRTVKITQQGLLGGKNTTWIFGWGVWRQSFEASEHVNCINCLLNWRVEGETRYA